MASKTLVTVEEYLNTCFEGPEPDYVDGEIIERHLGSIPHFEAQQRMLEFFNSLKQSFRLFGYPEVTLRLSPKRYRTADLPVFLSGRTRRRKQPPSPPHPLLSVSQI